jgi:hypothetical protein
MLRHEAATAESQKSKRFQNFSEWKDARGIQAEGCEFPVCWGKQGELFGVAAKQDFKPFEIIAKAPVSAMISARHVRQQLPLKQIYDLYPEVFEEHTEAQYLVLVLYVMYEMTQT